MKRTPDLVPEDVSGVRLASSNPLKRLSVVDKIDDEGVIARVYRYEDPLHILFRTKQLTRDQYDAARMLQAASQFTLHSPPVVFGYGERLGRGNDEQSDESVLRWYEFRQACLSIPVKYRDTVLDFVIFGKHCSNLQYLCTGLAHLYRFYTYD